MGLWRGVRDLSPSAVKKGVSFRNLMLKAVFCVFRFSVRNFTTNFFANKFLICFDGDDGVLCVLQAVQSLEISFGLP